MKYGIFFLGIADVVEVVFDVVVDVVVDVVEVVFYVVVDAVNKRSGRQTRCSLGFFFTQNIFPNYIQFFVRQPNVGTIITGQFHFFTIALLLVLS